MHGLYILVDTTPVPAGDLATWAQCQQDSAQRRVAETFYRNLWISTVFLGIDHGVGHIPILFETMVFDDTETVIDHYTQRYMTWEEAEAGHMMIVQDIMTNGVQYDSIDTDDTERC